MSTEPGSPTDLDEARKVVTRTEAVTLQRPLTITIVGWLFIVAGMTGLLYHLFEFRRAAPLNFELVLVCLIRLVAIVGGTFLLRGCNWARWLLAVWMAYHIVLSLFHSAVQLLTHVLLFGVIGYFLFQRGVSTYFASRAHEARKPPF